MWARDIMILTKEGQLYVVGAYSHPPLELSLPIASSPLWLISLV